MTQTVADARPLAEPPASKVDSSAHGRVARQHQPEDRVIEGDVGQGVNAPIITVDAAAAVASEDVNDDAVLSVHAGFITAHRGAGQ